MDFQTHTIESPIDEQPLQSAARNTTVFADDVVNLAELQGQLLLLESTDWFKLQIRPTVLIATAGMIAAGLVPICFLAIAAMLVEFAAFSVALALGVSLLIGVCCSSGLVAAAYFSLKSQSAPFARSSQEWKANVRWLRNMVRRQERRW